MKKLYHSFQLQREIVNMYYIYIVQCSDGTLYTGSTNNIEKRIAIHNTGKTGAKYTKIRRPVELVYQEQFETKSEALKREHAIKQLSRIEKLMLLSK